MKNPIEKRRWLLRIMGKSVLPTSTKGRDNIEKRLQTETFKRIAETFLGKKNFSWWAIFYASLIFIVTGWLPDGIAELLRKEWIGGVYKTLISVLVLLFIGIQLKKALKYKGRIEVISKEPDKVNVLSVFLSVLSMKKEIQDKELIAINQALNNGTFTDTALQGKTWEMPMIAIKHHHPKLNSLYVLTSAGEGGSSQLMPLFKRCVNRLFPEVEVIEFKEGGINFEDIKEVFEAIETFYKQLEGKSIPDSEVIVDITGGQKTNSIAGAIATLVIGRKFQYVSTIDKKVRYYDIGYFEVEKE